MHQRPWGSHASPQEISGFPKVFSASHTASPRSGRGIGGPRDAGVGARLADARRRMGRFASRGALGVGPAHDLRAAAFEVRRAPFVRREREREKDCMRERREDRVFAVPHCAVAVDHANLPVALRMCHTRCHGGFLRRSVQSTASDALAAKGGASERGRAQSATSLWGWRAEGKSAPQAVPLNFSCRIRNATP